MINLIAGVSVVSVAVPVAAMIVLLSVFNGFRTLVRQMGSAFDAELLLTPREGATFPLAALDTAALRRTEGVASLSFLLEQSALADYRGRQAIVTLRGVDDAYADVVPVADRITAGEWRVRRGELDYFVAGQGVAYALGMRSLREDDLTLYGLRRGSFSTLLPVDGYRRLKAPVAGVYAVDAQTDERYVLTSLRLAQELFDYDGRATALALRLAEGARAERVRDAVAAAAGDAFEVRTRDELNASFYRIMRYEKWGVFFISLLVLVVASFSIVGTLVMLILDKRPSFPTLRALGADRRFLRAIFEREGYLIGALGAAAGVVLGVGICLVQRYFGVVTLPAATFVVESYPVELRADDLLGILAAFAVVLVAITRLTVRRTIPERL